MKKILLTFVSLVFGAIALILLIASFRPQDWSFERSVIINAPRERVWAIASDFNRYNEWNPYFLAEPETKTSVDGPASSVGSSYSWDGEKSGAGKMTATGLKAPERMDVRIDFIRPMETTSSASYILNDLDGSTKMTWVMSGRHEGFPGLMSRAVHLFISLDDMLSESFQMGLERLKTISEKND